MNVVLVSIGTFQEYILINIRQLLRLGHTSIYVITNTDFFDKFAEYADRIHLISANELNDKFEYHTKTRMNMNFRDAFWVLTSSRFFYIYAFMAKYDIQDVIHLENDVPIYYHCDILGDLLDKTRIYIPMDAYTRAIASVVYIPRAAVLEKVLGQYQHNLNDMENFSILARNNPDLFGFFPICFSRPDDSSEMAFVTQRFSEFNMIFDAAAMGQYLGGVDPRNIAGDTTGFVNETCVIKYDEFEFSWKTGSDGIRRPFLNDGSEVYPIFNLHIHCKNLANFV